MRPRTQVASVLAACSGECRRVRSGSRCGYGLTSCFDVVQGVQAIGPVSSRSVVGRVWTGIYRHRGMLRTGLAWCGSAPGLRCEYRGMSGFTRNPKYYGDRLVYEALLTRWGRYHARCGCKNNRITLHAETAGFTVVRQGSGFVALVVPGLTEDVDEPEQQAAAERASKSALDRSCSWVTPSPGLRPGLCSPAWTRTKNSPVGRFQSVPGIRPTPGRSKPKRPRVHPTPRTRSNLRNTNAAPSSDSIGHASSTSSAKHSSTH